MPGLALSATLPAPCLLGRPLVASNVHGAHGRRAMRGLSRIGAPCLSLAETETGSSFQRERERERDSICLKLEKQANETAEKSI